MNDKESVMSAIPLDRNLPVPLHYQLQLGIRGAIGDGRLSPDDRLPSIHEYAKARGLSVSTVARAFGDLSREGLIVSKRGAGTRVAAPIKSTTDFLMTWRLHQLSEQKRAFFFRIIDGMRKGFDDPDRRLLFSHYDEESVSERELLAVCKARSVDSLVVYRPYETMTETLKNLSLQIPIVSLFIPVPGANIDSVVSNPAPALRTILREYLEQGYRKFVYLGISLFIERTFDPTSPYKLIFEEFNRFVRETGVEREVDIVNIDYGRSSDKEKKEAKKIGAKLPEDAVVVSATPDIVKDAYANGGRAQFITYTECAPSLHEVSNFCDVLFCELSKIGEHAAILIKDRLENERFYPVIKKLDTALYRKPDVK